MNIRLIIFFFNDTATTEIYTLSLHDALPIYPAQRGGGTRPVPGAARRPPAGRGPAGRRHAPAPAGRHECHRSEEHTSELQSPCNLVCRLLLEKKKKKNNNHSSTVTEYISTLD